MIVNMHGKMFSDKIYWQVADQPGKESPNCLRIVDLEGKEVKGFVILEQGRMKQLGTHRKAKVPAPDLLVSMSNHATEMQSTS